MTSSADVVVVGGGIIGLSTAYYLAKLGYGKVVVVEKEMFLGTGSTGKCAGGVRAQFSTKINIEMSMKSEEMLVQFEEETGWPAVYDQVGYMFLLSDEQELATFSKAMELQKSLGLKVDLIDPEEVAKLAPPVRTDDIIKATFCGQDGLADPNDLIQGYASAARKHGRRNHHRMRSHRIESSRRRNQRRPHQKRRDQHVHGGQRRRCVRQTDQQNG